MTIDNRNAHEIKVESTVHHHRIDKGCDPESFRLLPWTMAEVINNLWNLLFEKNSALQIANPVIKQESEYANISR